MALTTCASCQELVEATACRCPHCEATLRVCRTNRPLAAALLALTLAGCPKTDSDTDTDVSDTDTDNLPMPEYGAPASDL